MHSRSTLAALLVSLGLALAGCDKGDTPKSASHPANSTQQSVSTEQVEIEKYNAYVDAANQGEDFGELLEKRVELYSGKLAPGKKVTDYTLFSPYDISTLQRKLNQALAISFPMPELDEPAKNTLAALAKLEPIHGELANYSDSKGYLADDGKKARQMEPALEAAMKDVAEAQAVFFDGIRKRDEINTRTAFDNAEKDTLAYYRAGIVVYGKESARLASDFFASAGSEAKAKPLEESLNHTAQMIEGWDKKSCEQKRPASCSIVLSDLNGFVGKGREAVSNAKNGRYKRENSSELSWKISNPIKRDSDDLQRAFSKLINSMNRNDCI
ncbi:YiiG family protein [Pseudomonas viridiflava]|uniref:YiiG family protein n=1 Tax=Pseudomonas viridiflava TaxID=33069 RepID=UPI000F01CFD5|nr:YiiG family protein [Pseudomonas viridiflava]